MRSLPRLSARLAAALGVSLAFAGPVLAQRLGQAPADDVPVWRVLGAMLLCLALAVGAAIVMRRRLGVTTPFLAKGARRLELVETVRLSHQTDVCLLRLDGEELLISAGAGGAVLLARGPFGAGAPAP